MPSYFLNAEALNALLKVPHHLFATPEYKNLANSDSAMPLKHIQTISQPYVVALMTQIAKLGKMVFPCAEFSISEVNYLTKNKNEALGQKSLRVYGFCPSQMGLKSEN